MDNKKNTAKTIATALTLAAIIILSFVLGFVSHCASQSDTVKSVNEVMNLIEKYGILNSDVDPSQIASAISGLYLSEDEYSAYYTKNEYESVIAEDQGKFCGIGIQLIKNKDGGYSGRTIYDVTLNSPAHKAGIRANDILLAGERQNGEKIVFTDNNDSTKFLNETKETELIYLYIKKPDNSEKKVSVVKSQYVASYVMCATDKKAYCFLGNKDKREIEDSIPGLDKDTGYIRLCWFEGNASEQFAGAINSLIGEGKSKILLDLRGNGGGQMTILQDIASYLINNNKKRKNLLVYAKGKDSAESYYTSKNNFDDKIKKIVVMADENTASASECLIGAMLYYKDAFSIDNLVIGYNSKRENYSTFGKGIMQTTYTLKDGGALKLTTAKIYQPDKETCIHEKGITTTQANGVANVLERALEIING